MSIIKFGIFFFSLTLLTTAKCLGQIGLALKLNVDSKELISMTIQDSSDYVPEVNIPPSVFKLQFKKDSLISINFEYKVFGHVEVSDKSGEITHDVKLIRNSNQLSLFLYYKDPNYGSKLYILNGNLKATKTKSEFIFIPTGTNIIVDRNFSTTYFILPKEVKKVVAMQSKMGTVTYR